MTIISNISRKGMVFFVIAACFALSGFIQVNKASAADLSVTGSITISNKTYDGNTSASITTTSTAGLGGNKAGCPTTGLDWTSAVATFSASSVGNRVTVLITNLYLTATGTCSLAQVATTTVANITSRAITVTAATNSKVYDGTNTATGTPTLTSGTLAAGQTGTYTETYSNKTVATGKTLTPAAVIRDSGSADVSSNYTITLTNDTTGVISAKPLTVSNITASNKVYDRTTAATIATGTAVFVGVLDGDLATVTTVLTAVTGAFSDKNVADGKTVTIAGVSKSGADAGNYSIVQPTTTANITAKPLTVSNITASNKVYNGTTSATIATGTAVFVGVVAGDIDTVTTVLTAVTGTFDTKTVSTSKTVTIAGVGKTGADAGNYSITQPTTTANITARPITITATTNTKEYDGTTAAAAVPTLTSGTLASGETATYTETYDDKTADTDKVLTPAAVIKDAGDVNVSTNYTVTAVTDETGVITTKTLTVSGITASNKIYNGTTSATLNTDSTAFVGVVDGDTVTIDVSSAVGTFDSVNTGMNKTVTVTGVAKSGADAANYTITQPSTTATISANGTSMPSGGGGAGYVYIPPTPTPTPVTQTQITPVTGTGTRTTGSLIRYEGDTRVYVLENGMKRWIKTASDFAKLGYNWNNVAVISATETYSEGISKTYAAPGFQLAGASAKFTKYLIRGTQGDEVTLLQQKLQAFGFFPAEITANGIFGPTTQKSVMAYQKANGIPQTGNVGPLTRTSLNK
jgi:trimeric autotransporter adhesin